MKFSTFLWILIFIISNKNSISAQDSGPVINSRLNGKIIDSKTKETLPGASIQIKGTTHGVVSDADGNFYFQTGQKLPYNLVVNYIGYESKEILVENDYITISLEEEIKQLTELIVVGYGSQRKKDITGSVASVPKENLDQISPSVDNLLRGAIPGVQVTQSSGQPGASSSVRIRGGNSITGGNEPLYVIDGVLVYNDNNNGSTGLSFSGAGANVLATINPSDIENIEVLKDASATAIYGSRGANGVIIITTKKGNRGANTVSYQTYYGIQEVSKKLNLLNAADWATLRNDIQTSIGQTPSFTAAQIDALKTSGNYDWQSAAFRKAPVQNHQLSFSGGDEHSRYAISANYFGQKGVIIGSDFNRTAIRANYEKDISDRFKFGLNSTASNSTINGINSNSGSAALVAPNTLAGVLLTPPVVPIYNADGSFNVTQNPYFAAVNGYIQNPIADLNAVTNKTKLNRVLSSLFAEYGLLPGLTARVTANGDLINTKQNYYAPSFTTNGASNKGYAAVGSKFVQSWLSENTLNYNKTFTPNHQISLLGGYTYQYTKGELSNAGATNFVNDINKFNALQDGVAVKPFSDAFESVLSSWLFRTNYTLLNRYNFTISARADGSSRFGSASRWGYFPSAGISWNISEENFIKNLNHLSDAKLRLSVGSTGNQEIADYLSLASLGSVNYSFGGNIFTGFSPTRLSNPNLKWEKTTQYNAGLDVGLFERRISIVFDAYYKKTSDLLVNVPVPLTSGYTSVLQNIGAVENKGIELGITTENTKAQSLSWKTNFVFSANRNKVLEIGNGVQQFFPNVPSGVLQLQQPILVKVGQPLGTFWGYKTNGVFQNIEEISKSPTLNGIANTKPGDRKFQDINGDGKISAANDKTYLGSAQPKFIASVSNIFNYKGIDLNISFQGVYGNKIFNALNQQLEIPTLGNNAAGALADHWTTANPSNEIPRAASSPATVVSDRYIEDGSFVRLKTLTLGYTFPKSFYSKVKNLKIYASAQNLLTWTKYSGYDPEISSYEQSNLLPGIDYGAYPNARTITLGFNLSF